MRVLRVAFEAGRDLFEVFWNFLQSGGVVLASSGGAVQGEAVRCEVRIRALKKEWSFDAKIARIDERGRAFVAFEPGQDQEGMVNAAWADTYLVPERKHRRLYLRAEVRYAVGGSERAERPATLTNLSRGGCCIQTDERLPVGTLVHLTGAEFDSDAQVRWLRDPPSRELGLEFASPLALSEILR
jgi:hypothetical protein